RPMPLPGGERVLTVESRSGGWPRLYTRLVSSGEVVAESPSFQSMGASVFSPDLAWVAGASGVWIYINPVNGPTNQRVTMKNDGTKHFTGLAFHPSGKYLAATSNDTTVKIYDTTTWQLAKTYTWDVGKLQGVCFSPDGTRAAVGSHKAYVVVWDVDL